MSEFSCSVHTQKFTDTFWLDLKGSGTQLSLYLLREEMQRLYSALQNALDGALQPPVVDDAEILEITRVAPVYDRKFSGLGLRLIRPDKLHSMPKTMFKPGMKVKIVPIDNSTGNG